MRWTVVIPAKGFPGAKSRLAEVSTGPAAHRTLVEAIRADTVTAARAATAVARIVVVLDADADASGGQGPPGVDVRIVQVAPGLNGAVRDGVAHAMHAWPADGVAALVGDLPALRPEELDDALDAAAELGEGFVPDADGTGTTMLAAAPGHRLEPQFGAGSAARHGSRLPVLPAGPGLRRDVDTGADLDAAVADLHVGRETARVLAERTGTQGVQLPLR